MSEMMDRFAAFVGRKLGQARRGVRQSLCRHDLMRTTEGTRVFMRCASCGAETPGWDNADLPKPRVRFSGTDGRYFAGSTK